MSHFTVAVLIRDAKELTDRAYIESRVEELLAPYNENTQVEEYDRVCYCIGRVARGEARKAAEQACGTIDDLRKSFVNPFPNKSYWDLTEEESEVFDVAWEKHIAEFVRVEKEAFENHPLKDSPDPTCGFYSGERQSWWPENVKEGDRFDDAGCGATGTYKSTYNPKSQWDWWTIGGRWTGAMVGYDPTTDSENWQECWLCQGTGLRNDALGIQARKEDPTYTCNGCQGKGQSVRFYLKSFDGDVCPVSMVKDDFSTYAVVTPDGEWHQRGKMGWWGMSSGDMKVSEWKTIFKQLLADNADCVVALVDCHI